MKLLRSNGRHLEIYDIAATPLMRISSIQFPLKHNGWRIVEDDIARSLVREIIDNELYDVLSFRNKDKE